MPDPGLSVDEAQKAVEALRQGHAPLPRSLRNRATAPAAIVEPAVTAMPAPPPRSSRQSSAKSPGRRRLIGLGLVGAGLTLAVAATAAFLLPHGRDAAIGAADKAEPGAASAQYVTLPSASPRPAVAPAPPAAAPSAPAPPPAPVAKPAAADAVPEAYRMRAEAGDAVAQYGLAMLLIEGRAVAPDPVAAARWLGSAAAQGLADAQFRLGLVYEQGVGVAADPAQAAEWYAKAAAQGQALAQYNLGLLYAKGLGVSQSMATAAGWFHKAADQGVVPAAFNYAVLLASGNGVAENDEQAIAYFQRAASAGDGEARARAAALEAKQRAGASGG